MSCSRALISVSDKTGIVDCAKALVDLGISILSTGGTAALFKQHNIPVTDISDYTKSPEIMDGRVKTLHPKVHGGILARRDIDQEICQEMDITMIDLVIVNLYPFAATIAKPDCTFEQAIENIDIGGPTMIRAAAKNHADVGIVVDPQDYPTIIEELQQQQQLSNSTRFQLAQKAFAHTAQYDATIANYLGCLDDNQQPQAYPSSYTVQFQQKQSLRYGENPHQHAGFYVEQTAIPGTVAHSQQLQGKALSFNNIADADAAIETVFQFEQPACVIVKHANPCGVAIAENISQAYQRAFKTDPTSSFGGIIAFNRALDGQTAQTIIDQQFVEVIIAPEVTPQANTVLQSKANVRVLACGWPDTTSPKPLDYKKIRGGLLLQTHDEAIITANDIQVVSQRQATPQEIEDCLFAWKVVKQVKSNAIVYCKDQATIGIGAGQMSRVYSAKIAALKAQDEGLTVKGSVMASDAFFPFRDGIDTAAAAGITAIIQPGGSIRDQDIIQAADEANIAMLFTHIRHFKH